MYNPYIVVPLAVWAVVQIIKFVLASLKGNIDFRFLYASGGMPSAHSAVVSALATTAALQDGLQSQIFGVTAIVAAIVMYDSLGVRRAVGEQATALNLLLEGMTRDRVKQDHPVLKLREVLGHYPREVVVGALLGISMAGLFSYDRLGWLTGFVTSVPGGIESLIYLIVAAALIVIGLVVRFVLPWRVPKSVSLLRLAKLVFVYFEVAGWTGLVLWFAINERVSYLAWRLWWVLLAISIAVALWHLARAALFQIPKERAAELTQERRAKWFNWGRKRKNKHK